MENSLSTCIGLCVPINDFHALTQGRTIAALTKIFIYPGNNFILYPANAPDTVTAWAKCELCPVINPWEHLDILSQITIWTPKILQQYDKIFLAHLRVYRLTEPYPVPSIPDVNSKIGRYISLPDIQVSEAQPVLSDRIFYQRHRQLKNLEPPQNPELEELRTGLRAIASTHAGASELEWQINIFLGWEENQPKHITPELDWINNIAALGKRSIQEDQGKSNYQAGTDFENVVRQSLEFLGFTLDNTHKGGPGGLDLLCSQPYPLFGECKAGKKIPNDTAVQLLNLGKLHEKELFDQAVKIIIGAGKPTTRLKQAAETHAMAIINPETLEELVKLQHRYPNSIDLFKLKEYLKPGQIDEAISNYINYVYNEIQLRSDIIQEIKKYQENSKNTSVSVDIIRGICSVSIPKSITLTPEEIHEILIELSSPLTGYLGREKGETPTSDRFYFLRELVTK